MNWRTSSYSATNGDCVEVGWRTSSYSATNGNCVEVAGRPGAVLVRDTKDRGGPALAVERAAWLAFVADVARG